MGFQNICHQKSITSYSIQSLLEYMLNTKCSNGSGSFVAAAPHEVQYKISIQELQPYNILWVNLDHETFGHILELYFDSNTQWMDK